MKILHTVQLYDPCVGGSEEVVKQVSERLARRGHEVTVATASDPRRESEYINGVRVVGFGLSGNEVRGIKGDPEAYKGFLLNGRFDVMMNYAAQIWSSDLVFSLLTELDMVKVFIPCGYSALYDKRYRGYFENLPAYLRQYDHLIYHSADYRDKLFGDKQGFTHQSVIPNGAAAEEFTGTLELDFRDKYGIDGPMLLSVANHHFIKGHALVIEAFAKSFVDGATLVIIGNPARGGCQESCAKLAERVTRESGGRKKVILLSGVSRSEVVAAYRQADLFVFGSQVECFPLVLVEAMASRTPFISTDCGSAKELAGGVIVASGKREEYRERGRLSKVLSAWRPTKHAADPRDMAEAISTIMASQSEREKLGRAGFDAWTAQYDWERVVDKYEALYLQLVGGAVKNN